MKVGPDNPDQPYMAANGHQYTWRTRYDRDCLDTCPCHSAESRDEYGRPEDYAGEQWDED